MSERDNQERLREVLSRARSEPPKSEPDPETLPPWPDPAKPNTHLRPGKIVKPPTARTRGPR